MGSPLTIMEGELAELSRSGEERLFGSEDKRVTTVEFGSGSERGYGLTIVVSRPRPQVVAELVSGFVQKLGLGVWGKGKSTRELRLSVDDSDAFLMASERYPERTGRGKGQTRLRGLREDCEDGHIVEFGVWSEGRGGTCAPMIGEH